MTWSSVGGFNPSNKLFSSSWIISPKDPKLKKKIFEVSNQPKLKLPFPYLLFRVFVYPTHPTHPPGYQPTRYQPAALTSTSSCFLTTSPSKKPPHLGRDGCGTGAAVSCWCGIYVSNRKTSHDNAWKSWTRNEDVFSYFFYWKLVDFPQSC